MTTKLLKTLEAENELAIPAGISPYSNFNSLRQVRHQIESTETKRFWNECLTF